MGDDRAAERRRWEGEERVPRPLLLALVGALGAAGVVLLGIVIASRVLDRATEVFVVEISQYYPHVLWYAGAFALLAVLVWWTAAVACLLAALDLWQAGHGGAAARPFLALGLFSGLLVLDDAFRIHEIMLEAKLGLSDWPVYAIYGVLFVATVLASREVLLRSWPVLALAVGFFAGSATLDVLRLDVGERAIVEEGLKFLGIVTWTTLLVWLSVTRGATGRRVTGRARS